VRSDHLGQAFEVCTALLLVLVLVSRDTKKLWCVLIDVLHAVCQCQPVLNLVILGKDMKKRVVKKDVLLVREVK
jgi:hypothetical protein